MLETASVSALTLAAPPETGPTRVDILIVGSGFAGIAMAVRLKRAGMTSVLVIEKGPEIGGTWRDNTYPGAACDIPSHLYSLSFAPKSDWSRTYPEQSELQAYLLAVVDRHGLRPNIRLNTAMEQALWDETTQSWRVTSNDRSVIEARILISAVGALHEPFIPAFPGLETFAHKAFHSSAWDHDYDLSGKRVAVIGTGASAVQFVPKIAAGVARLMVFQRTAPWIQSKTDRRIGARRQMALRFLPFYRRLLRAALFLTHEVRFIGFAGALGVMKGAEALAIRHLEQAISDPHLRTKLTPRYRLGCKRVLISNDFYPALTQDTSELVTDAIAEVTDDSIRTVDGRSHPCDTIIYATGFRVTERFRRLRIVGRAGALLSDHCKGGMETYLGVAVSGFPNFFILLGPNTGLGHNSVVLMIEAQVHYIVGALRQMKRRRLRTIDVKDAVMRTFAALVQRRMAKTVWQDGGCSSWYQDETGRNTTIWPGSFVEYWLRTRVVNLGNFDVTPEAEPRFTAPQTLSVTKI